ncbi:MAG: GntR family transcriptional regulator [Halanaerobiaceae bacterium]|nr:GntR family transcriptional regulator [Halanaerobiaceae bacterium]
MSLLNLSIDTNIDSRTMKDYVYQVLKRNIMELRLKPGSPLKKEKISRQLQVSVTPVREAFAKLAEDDLVDILPQNGTFVSHINIDKIIQAQFMRENMELAVIKLACEMDFPKDRLFKLQTIVKMQEILAEEENLIQLFELDNQFHRIVFETCNKKYVWEILQQVSTHIDRIRVLSLTTYFNRKEIIADHQKIIDAIKDKNLELAERVVKEHTNRIKYDIEKMKEKYSDYFD